MNRNSARIWLPVIEAAGLPSCPTVMVPYNHSNCMPIFDGEPSAEFDRVVSCVTEAIKVVGSPAFIRTDLASAKHSGPKAYLTGDDPVHAVCRTIEDSEMKFWTERHGPTVIMVRKFLSLDAPFVAFGGLPVSREWRFFADQDHVICYHPYWPAEALDEHVREDIYDDVDWRDLLAELHEEPVEIAELKSMAVRAAQACGNGSWSVDFAKDKDGKWWLLDMAVMENSYHWPECPNALKGERHD